MANYPQDPRAPISFTAQQIIIRVDGIDLPTIVSPEDERKYGAYFRCTQQGTGHIICLNNHNLDLETLRHDLRIIAEMYAEECAEAVLEQDYV